MFADTDLDLGLEKSPSALSASVKLDVVEPQLHRGDALDLSRHDEHNLELKFSVFEDRLVSNLELYMFFPRSFNLRDQGKGKLMSDFRTRWRQILEGEDEDYSLKEIKDLMTSLVDSLRSEVHDKKSFEMRLKKLGSLFSEYLKLKHRSFKKKARDISDSGDEASVLLLCQQLRLSGQLLQTLRKEVIGRDVLHPELLRCFDEYLHYLMTQHWAKLNDQLREMDIQNGYDSIWYEIFTTLKTQQKEESVYNQEKKFICNFEDSSQREAYLARISRLKKFFQSTTYIEAERKDPKKKIMEPAAASAAVMAAVAAAVVQQAADGRWQVVGQGGLLLICFGVLIYAFRDRLKDRGRVWLNQWLGKHFPDFEETLVAGGRSLGRVKTSLNLSQRTSVPREIRRLRKRVAISSVDRKAEDDIVVFKQSYLWQKKYVSELAAENWGLQEILRINLARHVKYMDDSYKDLHVLDDNGEVRNFRTHKIYKVHIFAKERGLTSTGDFREQVHVFCLDMDRSGVSRLTKLSM